MFSAADSDTIEALIDKHGLHSVLLGIGAVCSDKADHIRASYETPGNGSLSLQWDIAGEIIGETACHSTIVTISPEGA